MEDYKFLLKENALADFLDYSKIQIAEIGDGNLNFVFKIYDDKNCYAIKHAKPYLKMLGEDFKLTSKRVIAEMNSMEYFHSLCPEFIPKIYKKNEKEYFFMMEYLDNFSSLRNSHKNISSYEKLGSFLYSLSISTPKKKLYYECEELKQITKNYVFEYPFIKNHKALVILDYAPQKTFSKEFLYNLTSLKEIFLYSKKSLIHGDLHTDSVMIKDDNIAIIDSEFSLFSEVSFDIGNLLAHILFSSIEHKDKLYIDKIVLLLDQLSKIKEFKNILQNSIGFCSVEMARRLYVPAKSKNLENISSISKKESAYKLSFNLADELGANIKNTKDIDSFLYRLEKCL